MLYKFSLLVFQIYIIPLIEVKYFNQGNNNWREIILKNDNKLYGQEQGNQGEKVDVPAKRVNVVSLKMVKECSVLYKNRVIRSPEDGYELLKQFLGDVDREHFVVICLDTKSQPTAINVCHIGSLNASLVHPREVMKPAILSNAASILGAHIGMNFLGRNSSML